MELITGADGRALFGEVLIGEYDLTVTHPQFKDRSLQVTVPEAGVSVEVMVDPKSGTVLVLVLGPGGAPVGGARVVLEPRG